MVESGEIKDYKIAPTLVENVHGLTYGQADSLILYGQEKYAKATAQYLPLHLQEEQQLLAAPDADEREERKVRTRSLSPLL
jgi:exoribonuclease R